MESFEAKRNLSSGPPPVSVMPPFYYTPPPYNGPSAEEILALRNKYLIQQTPYYEKPLNLVDGKMQYVFDEKGKRYLDALAGIAVVSIGHCHPAVEEAVVEQIRRIQHTTVLYLNHTLTDYLQALATKMPGNLKVFYLLNSGTEANELAMLMARLYTGCNDIISLRNAYHGIASTTMATNGLRTEKFNVVQTGIHHAMNPNPYRGEFGSDGKKYAQDVQNIIDHATSGKVAGFISEAIQGVGGIIELVHDYLPAVYEIIRKAGGLCIADEVITGFGRTGSNFWAFENHNVIPDIVTMAKVGFIILLFCSVVALQYGLCALTFSSFHGINVRGIGNGCPLSAVVTTPEIAKVLSTHSYYSTFAGNQISTAVGLAVLNVIDRENLQYNAFVVGSHLKARLIPLKDKYEIIGDVRGRGFMQGVEFVTNQELKTPATEETDAIYEEMKEMGVLVGKAGLHSNVLRIMPPLCFTMADADVMDKAIWSITNKFA